MGAPSLRTIATPDRHKETDLIQTVTPPHTDDTRRRGQQADVVGAPLRLRLGRRPLDVATLRLELPLGRPATNTYVK